MPVAAPWIQRSIDRSTFGFFFLVFYEPERNQSNSLMDVLIE